MLPEISFGPQDRFTFQYSLSPTNHTIDYIIKQTYSCYFYPQTPLFNRTNYTIKSALICMVQSNLENSRICLSPPFTSCSIFSDRESCRFDLDRLTESSIIKSMIKDSGLASEENTIWTEWIIQKKRLAGANKVRYISGEL